MSLSEGAISWRFPWGTKESFALLVSLICSVPLSHAVDGGIDTPSALGRVNGSAVPAEFRLPNPSESSQKSQFESFLSKGCDSYCLIYPVNVVEITRKPKNALKAETYRKAFENIVSLLNQDFRMENGKKIFHFELKGFQKYPSSAELMALSKGCKQLLRLGDQAQEYDTDESGNPYVWKEYIEQCQDARYNDPNAINVYLYDSYSAADGFSNQDGHGNYNWSYSYHGYAFLDYERVKSGYEGTQNYRAEAHEIGHLMGLDHVCDLSTTGGSSASNLMSSARETVAVQLPLNKNKIAPSSSAGGEFKSFPFDCPSSSQGSRERGLTASQVFTVLLYANKHLGMNPSEGGAAGGWLAHQYKYQPALSP